MVLALLLLLAAMNRQMPLENILRFLEQHSRESTALIALGMLFTFLLQLVR